VGLWSAAAAAGWSEACFSCAVVLWQLAAGGVLLGAGRGLRRGKTSRVLCRPGPRAPTATAQRLLLLCHSYAGRRAICRQGRVPPPLPPWGAWGVS
jgi:hypothetical protein